MELISGSMAAAAGVLQRALDEGIDDPALRTQISVTLSYAQFHTGQPAAAMRTVEEALTTAERLGEPWLLSQALGMRTMFRFLAGDGIDEPSLRCALDLEDRRAPVPFPFRASAERVMLLGWSGQLEQARDEILAIRRDCIEHGEESELLPVAFQQVLIGIWRGDFAEATGVAEDAIQRAVQMGGELSLAVALMFRAAVGAYSGREDEARRDAADSIAACQRVGWLWLAGHSISVLGFLDVSLGNYDAALKTLEPLLATLETQPNGTEIIPAGFLPDAVEAMVNLDRPGQAEPLVDRLERNGRRLDRPWMLAVGARCRAMVLAAHGDLDAASLAVQRALIEHRRLPMPFERARTEVLLGQLQHRQGNRDAASTTLSGALRTFEELDTPLWAERARAALARADRSAARGGLLTPAEQRVAELVASGLSNRDIAAALFISVKTVETNLTRAYRKLGVRSRVGLARYIDRHKLSRNGAGPFPP
ncbi:MAG: response regulator transcription factor [Candidatus Sericytochromatia bacterium]